MNGPARDALTGEMLAYVDNCLPREDRLSFECRMIEDPAIRRQVSQWRFQNDAIRAAFPDPTARPPSGGRKTFAGLGPAVDRTAQGVRALRENRTPTRRPLVERPNEIPRPRELLPTELDLSERAAARPPGAARRALFAIIGALALWMIGGLIFSNDQPLTFVRAGAAAYRTYAANELRPVEMATSDRAVLNAWLAPQLPGAAAIPDLSEAGLTLLGGRVVPGAAAPASFALYDNAQGERIGFYAEVLDAPATGKVRIKTCDGLLCASWLSGRHGFLLVGAVTQSRMSELARLIGGAQRKM